MYIRWSIKTISNNLLCTKENLFVKIVRDLFFKFEDKSFIMSKILAFKSWKDLNPALRLKFLTANFTFLSVKKLSKIVFFPERSSFLYLFY